MTGIQTVRDALDCSDPHNVEHMRQPWPDPFKTVEGFFVACRPNWALPYLYPEPAVEASERQLRAEDV